MKKEVMNSKKSIFIISLLLLFSAILLSHPVNSAFTCGDSLFKNGTMNVLNGDTINGTHQIALTWSGASGVVRNVSIYYRNGTGTRVFIRTNVTLNNATNSANITWSTASLKEYSSAQYVFNVTIFNATGGTAENTHMQCQYSAFLIDNTVPSIGFQLVPSANIRSDSNAKAEGSLSSDIVDTALSCNITLTDPSGSIFDSTYLANSNSQDCVKQYSVGTFHILGIYTVNLTVYDNVGQSNTSTLNLRVLSSEDQIPTTTTIQEVPIKKSNVITYVFIGISLLAVIIILLWGLTTNFGKKK